MLQLKFGYGNRYNEKTSCSVYDTNQKKIITSAYVVKSKGDVENKRISRQYVFKKMLKNSKNIIDREGRISLVESFKKLNHGGKEWYQTEK